MPQQLKFYVNDERHSKYMELPEEERKKIMAKARGVFNNEVDKL